MIGKVYKMNETLSKCFLTPCLFTNTWKYLICQINNSGCNVTMDRPYTSTDVAEELRNNHKPF
jgi:hypothetical protein